MVSLSEYVRIAITNLAHRKTRSYLTMIGIFIGIAAVVSLISLGQGLKDAVGAQFASIGTDKVIVQAASVGFGPPGTGAVSNLTDKDYRVIKSVPGVETLAARILRPVSVEFNKKSTVTFAGSMPQDQTRKLFIEAQNIKAQSGRLIEPGDKFKIMIGYNLAYNEVFSRPIQINSKVLINGQEFTIVGIMEKTGNPTADNAVLMNEQSLRDLVKDQNNYDAIIAKVSKGSNVESVAATIERTLRKSRNVKEGKEDFKVQSSTALLKSLDSILDIVQIVLIGIAAISLIVGGIGIMNTMYTSVLERTKEIGIMKAIGAQNKDILFIFLIESGLLGTIGGIIGIAIGIGLAKLVEIAAFSAFGKSILQASFSWQVIIGALAFSFIIGSLSGLWPAMQASSLKPVDALRYE